MVAAKHVWIVSALALAAVLGCQGTVVTPIARLDDKVVGTKLQPATFVIGLKQAPYAVLATNLEWDTAVATLANSDAARQGAIKETEQDKPATIDPVTGTRTTNFLYEGLLAGAGYTLTVTLKRAGAVVAAGSRQDFELHTGANRVNVTLTPPASSGGGGTVTIPPPNTLETAVTTNSHFDVARVAGAATGGYAAGTGPLTATFDAVAGLDVDASGTLYVADPFTHVIRRVPAAGPTTIVAGTVATPGNTGDGGAATGATLDTPIGIVRDHAADKLFFCDSGNDRIRAIMSGQVLAFAGGGVDGGANVANAANAALAEPFAVALDQLGTMYFTEKGSGRVRKIAPSMALTTLATLAPGSEMPLAVDRRNDRLWTVDAGTVVRTIDLTGGVSGAIDIGFTVPAGSIVAGLATNHVSTLYVATSSPDGLTDARVWRVPVGPDGRMMVGRASEAIAGRTGTGLETTFDVPTVAVPNALTQRLAGASWCGLALDIHQSNAAGAAAGALYAGNTYVNGPSRWAQLLRLAPGGP